MNKPFLIGIAGGSGSGKTFFLKCFLQHFTASQVCLVSQDDYYKAIETQATDKNGFINFDLPECIDDEQLFRDLNSLLAGDTVQKKEYTFNVPGYNAQTITYEPAPFIILEGIFIFHFKKISSLLNMKIFLDVEEELALNRRLERDICQRAYRRDEILYQWKNHVLPAYINYLLPYKDSAEIIIPNNTNSLETLTKASKEISDRLKAQFFIKTV